MAETTRDTNRMSPKGLQDFAMRLAQFQFPGDEPSDAEKTLEIRPVTAPAAILRSVPPPVAAAPPVVPVVRPPTTRPTANATQEIDAADVLEVEPIDHHPCSVIPVALDVEVAARRPRAADLASPVREGERGSERFAMPRQPRQPRQGIGWGLGAAIVGVGCLLLAVVNATHASAHDAKGEAEARPAAVLAARAAAAQAPTQGTASQPAATVGGVPVVSVLSLPRVVPTTGTIKLIEAAAAHRLYVDGAVQAGASAVVTCGRHMIQVGSAGKAHALIIGCGEETVIAR